MYPRGRIGVVERSGVREVDLESPRYTPALRDPYPNTSEHDVDKLLWVRVNIRE